MFSWKFEKIKNQKTCLHIHLKRLDFRLRLGKHILCRTVEGILFFFGFSYFWGDFVEERTNLFEADFEKMSHLVVKSSKFT